MVANASVNFSGDVQRYISQEVLPVAQRFLVVRQFSTKVKIPEGMGTTYTATRFNRLPLPYGPLNEGVPPVGETISITQVNGVAQQWGDKVTVPDVADLTIKHPVVQQGIRLLQLQVPETYERNLFNQLMSGTQVNYVNSRGARANLVAGDVLDPTTVNRTVVNLKNLGARMWNGPDETDVRRNIEEGPAKSMKTPMASEHYVAVGSPLILSGDFASNATVQLAWSWSDINKLYINEVGQWRGMHFCESNLMPYWVGIAENPATAHASGGALADGTYYLQVTGSDTQNQYESQIYQINASGKVVTGGGGAGSITLTTPSTAGYTYSVYIGTSSTMPLNLGLSLQGPTVGPFAGQAVQIPPSTAVTITGLGLMQIPPAAPQTGVTVFRTLVFGKEAFASIELDRLTWTRLFDADKSDPLNQLRIVGWKGWDGTIITNQQFMAGMESATSNNGAFG